MSLVLKQKKVLVKIHHGSKIKKGTYTINE
ncbi:hypothetical protein CLV60_101121 [Dyadobacter jiangsuensis]|uniref:Uncharacterized protein n=1 Tax=Dyadobacter jiangsuensis TaxID=1591085 RepID=A0A2P8GIF2_9BACT|nr:hypothetical protein CLV60_101121 [Dyadobacter jiangsuensis]